MLSASARQAIANPTVCSVERFALLVQDGMKAISLCSGLGPDFSPLALKMWCQLYNLTFPHPEHNLQTAYQMLNPGCPAGVLAKPYGCLCFVTPPKELTEAADKPLPRGRESILVGYREVGLIIDSYFTIDLECFLSPLVHLSIRRTVDIRSPDGEPQFPIRKLREQQRVLDFTRTNPIATEAELEKAICNLLDPKAEVGIPSSLKKVAAETCEHTCSIFDLDDGPSEEDGGLDDIEALPASTSSSSASGSLPAAPAELPISESQRLSNKLKELKSFGGGKGLDGRITRTYGPSKRPSSVPTEVWSALGPSGQKVMTKAIQSEVIEVEKQIALLKVAESEAVGQALALSDEAVIAAASTASALSFLQMIEQDTRLKPSDVHSSSPEYIVSSLAAYSQTDRQTECC